LKGEGLNGELKKKYAYEKNADKFFSFDWLSESLTKYALGKEFYVQL